jgi:MOSC domain-containing protein YiiM
MQSTTDISRTRPMLLHIFIAAACGVRLNDLVGVRFRIGPVLVEGLDLCEPCSLLRKRTHPEIMRLLRNKGGLRARVIDGGVLAAGDKIARVNLDALI